MGIGSMPRRRGGTSCHVSSLCVTTSERRNTMWRQVRVVMVLLFLAVPAFAQNVQRSEMSFNVHWFGAVPSDHLDDTAAFILAVAAVPSYGRIYVPRGEYNISNTITVNKHRVHFEGDGVWATTINFAPVT